MVDFEVDEFELVGLWALVRSDFNAFVGANSFTLAAGDAEVLAGFRVDCERQATAEVWWHLWHHIGKLFGDRLFQAVPKNCFQSFGDLPQAFDGSGYDIRHGSAPTLWQM